MTTDDFAQMQGIVTLEPEHWPVPWLRTERRATEPIIFIEAEAWPYETFYCGEMKG